MIVDTSALMAVILGENEAERFIELIEAGPVAISAGTLVEAEIVVHRRRGERALLGLREVLREARFEVVPVDEQQAMLASDAHRRYGRGSGSAANLNYGDCFSYALAISRDEPLLFKGDDFIHTDVRVAAPLG